MEIWDSAWEGIFTFMDEMIPGLTEGIESFFYMINDMWDMLKIKINEVSLGLVGPDAEEIISQNIQTVVADQKISDAELERLRSQMDLDEVDKETLRKSLEKLVAAQAAGDVESTNQIINALSQMRDREAGTERQEVWEEVDNITITRTNADQEDV
jgi:hypothetical protein